MDNHSDYTLLILPPDAVEDHMRAWVEPTPGASLPSWGAHITLLNAFSPTQGLAAVQTTIEQVCARFRPFIIRLDRVVSRTHLARPHLQAVFLTSNPSENGHLELVRLQNELEVALAPLKRDLSQKIAFPDYNPHLSLTWGLPAAEAGHLVEAAQRASLHVEFQVDKIWLLCFSPSLSVPKQVERVKAFPLGVTAGTEKPK
jgi:hypothetical protein